MKFLPKLLKPTYLLSSAKNKKWAILIFRVMRECPKLENDLNILTNLIAKKYYALSCTNNHKLHEHQYGVAGAICFYCGYCDNINMTEIEEKIIDAFYISANRSEIVNKAIGNQIWYTKYDWKKEDVKFKLVK